MKKAVASGIVLGLLVLFATMFLGSENLQRNIKSIKSDFGGGLERTVTVYDYNGGEIKSYTGKFDVSESENEVFFDLNGKRVIIHGGIVIDEENIDEEN